MRVDGAGSAGLPEDAFTPKEVGLKGSPIVDPIHSQRIIAQVERDDYEVATATSRRPLSRLSKAAAISFPRLGSRWP